MRILNVLVLLSEEGAPLFIPRGNPGVIFAVVVNYLRDVFTAERTFFVCRIHLAVTERTEYSIVSAGKNCKGLTACDFEVIAFSCIYDFHIIPYFNNSNRKNR